MPPYDARRTPVVADRASVEDDYLVTQLVGGRWRENQLRSNIEAIGGNRVTGRRG